MAGGRGASRRPGSTHPCAPEPGKAIEFFSSARVSLERDARCPRGTIVAAWLWQRPAPHDIAIVPGKAGGFHHAAFVVDSADARSGRQTSWHVQTRIDYDQDATDHARNDDLFLRPSGTASRRSRVHGVQMIRIPGIRWTQDQIGPAVFYYSQE